MGEENVKALLSTNLGLFGESQCANSEEARAGTKNCGLCFLGYAFHSIGYRFLVVKCKVYYIRVGTIMESNDATFFEDIFPMKDMSTSSNQEMPSSSNQESVTITEPTISMEHFENHVEENNEVPTRSKRQRTAVSFGDDFLCIS